MTFIYFWDLSYIWVWRDLFISWGIVMDGRNGLEIELIWLRIVCLEYLRCQPKNIHLICRLLLPEYIRRQHYISARLFPAFGLDFNILKDLFILSNIPKAIVLMSSVFPSAALVWEYFLSHFVIVLFNLLNKVRWLQFLMLDHNWGRRSMITRDGMASSNCALWNWNITSLDRINGLFRLHINLIIIRLFIYNYLCLNRSLVFRNSLYNCL